MAKKYRECEFNLLLETRRPPVNAQWLGQETGHNNVVLIATRE